MATRSVGAGVMQPFRHIHFVMRWKKRIFASALNEPQRPTDMNDHSHTEITSPGRSGSILGEMYQEVASRIFEIDGVPVMADADVAALYGVETRVINQAVSRNAERFPDDYRFQVPLETIRNLKSQNVTSNWGGTRKAPYVFTEKGLYMLATVLKSKRATEVTFAIIETFAKVRELKSELVALHKETGKEKQPERMHRFSELLSDIVMPDLETAETESTLELNFFIGKIKHTVKRVRRNDGTEDEEDK